MWLLVRTVFWLSLVIALLPVTSSQQETSASQVGAIDTLSAASAAVSDIRQFCVRQPGACAAGSRTIVLLWVGRLLVEAANRDPLQRIDCGVQVAP